MSFTITLDKSSALIGTRIRITATDASFKFAVNVHNNVVYIGNIVARIIYLGDPAGGSNPTQLVAIVPDGCRSGSQSVQVFNKATGAFSVAASLTVTYPDVKITVTETAANSSKFNNGALKIQPIYDRDLSYTNFTEITDATGVVQNVLSIILTRTGERLFNTDVGTDVNSLLFSLVTNPLLTQSQILYEIKTQVELYEPRAKIDAPNSFVDFDSDNNLAIILISVIVPGGTTKELGITLSTVQRG